MRIVAMRAALVALAVVVVAVPGTTAKADVAAFGAVGAVAVSPTTGRVLVGIDDRKAGACLWWSDDHGAHWRVARGLGKASGVTALAFSQSQPKIAYAGVISDVGGPLGSGVLVSSDGGASWSATTWKQRVTVFRGTLPAAIDELVVHPSHPDTVYADTHGVLRRTSDRGMTWAVARNGLPPTVRGGGVGEVGVVAPRDQQLAADAQGRLYFATGLARGPGQIYRSTNRGVSWHPTGKGLPPAAPGTRLLQLASDVTRATGSVYAAGSRGVYATRNAGHTWTRILSTSALSVHIGPALVFVLAVQQRGPARLLRRDSAGAEAWTRLAGPRIDAFTVDPTNSSQLYGWSYDEDGGKERYCASLFGSNDRGGSWESIGNALPLVRRNCSSG